MSRERLRAGRADRERIAEGEEGNQGEHGKKDEEQEDNEVLNVFCSTKRNFKCFLFRKMSKNEIMCVFVLPNGIPSVLWNSKYFSVPRNGS